MIALSLDAGMTLARFEPILCDALCLKGGAAKPVLRPFGGNSISGNFSFPNMISVFIGFVKDWHGEMMGVCAQTLSTNMHAACVKLGGH